MAIDRRGFFGVLAAAAVAPKPELVAAMQEPPKSEAVQQNVIVQLDSEVIARAVINGLPQHLKLYGVR